MNYTDLLTIAMPVYERKDYFLEALESAINQTVKCKIFVVDNCSSHDYFEKICTQKGITYYRNKSNIGMSPNFNRCFELAQTEYVMTLQDDDILDPTYVESFCKAVEEHPDIDVYYTDFVRNTPTGEFPHQHTLPFGYMGNGDKVIEYAIRYKLGFPYMTSSTRRTKFSGFYAKFQGCNDWVWLYSDADKLVFNGDPRKLYKFRDHDNQDTKNNALNYRVTVPYIYEEILKNKTNSPEIRKIAATNAFWALIQLKSDAERQAIDEFVTLDNIFSNYLKTKLSENRTMKVIFLLPRSVVTFGYRFSKKIGICN